MVQAGNATGPGISRTAGLPKQEKFCGARGLLSHGLFLEISSKGAKQILEGKLLKEIREFIQSLFHPPKTTGFTVVIMSENSLLYHCYLENRAVATRLVSCKRSLTLREGGQG